MHSVVLAAGNWSFLSATAQHVLMPMAGFTVAGGGGACPPPEGCPHGCHPKVPHRHL
jgi:hypothetical protein